MKFCNFAKFVYSLFSFFFFYIYVFLRIRPLVQDVDIENNTVRFMSLFSGNCISSIFV